MNDPARPKNVPSPRPRSSAKIAGGQPRSRGWNLRTPPDHERCTFIIREGGRARRCAKYRWSGGAPLPLCRNHNMEARELVRDEGRRGGRASAARTASAKLLAAPVAVAAIRTPADLMINMRRVIYRLARSELSPPSANALLRGLEHERDRILRHVDPDIVEGGGGFFRDLRRRRDQDGDSARRVETESMSSSLDLDELNRPVRGDELTMIQRGLEHDAVHGRPPPEDWRGCVRRYLVEERSDVAYEDETMRRVVGLYRYRVVEGRRPQDVKVQRVFVPIRRVEGGGAHRAATT